MSPQLWEQMSDWAPNEHTCLSSFSPPLQPLLWLHYPWGWCKRAQRYWGKLRPTPELSLNPFQGTRDVDPFQGTREASSGCLASGQNKPISLRWHGILAFPRDLLMMLLTATWREGPPLLYQQLRLWVPKWATSALQRWHWWGWHKVALRWSPTPMWMTPSYIRKTTEEIGKALS